MTSLKANLPAHPAAGLLDLTARSQLRADVVVKWLLHLQLLEMEKNEAGVCLDSDPEYLHDFRVAVRRSRTLLSQAQGVLPRRIISRFGKQFAWLGDITGPARDIDVHLITFENNKQSLPEHTRVVLAPLYQLMHRHELLERDRLIKHLGSNRYRKLKLDWGRYLCGDPPGRTTLVFATTPSGDYFMHCIKRLRRRAIRKGNRISSESPPDALHTLRKTCKKLRYMYEFSGNLDSSVKTSIQALKNLQDNLGKYHDAVVQEVGLRQFICTMERETGITPATLKAINALAASLAKKQDRMRAGFAKKYRKFAEGNGCTAR